MARQRRANDETCTDEAIIRTMDTRLLELMVCPVTKGPLEYDRERQELTSRSARLAYPVRDDIPVLLESEARVMTDEELGL